MALSGRSGAAAGRKHLRVLLPFSRKSLRIPDELAVDIGAAEAHVEIPFGKSKGKVRRRVEVGRDGDGAFLGRGWKEFAAACGVGAGWLLVLRHRGGGVLTVKAFDDSGCLRELAAQPPAVEAIASSNGASRKPQFIIVVPQDFMEKMQIPAVFVQSYIPKEDMNSNMAVVYVPLGKTGHIEVEVNRSDVFFAGGWSKFLSNNSITATNCLLLRYEGRLVFTLKVFEPNGFQRESKHSDIIFQQTDQNMVTERIHKTPSASIQKCNSNNNRLGSEGKNKEKISKTYLGKESFAKYSFYKIEPPSWIQKQITTTSLKKRLALARAFCDAIGLRESRMITLKISMDSNASWQVHGMPSKNSSYMIMGGWKRFCKENRLKEGDICTFNIVEPTLWNVVITRYNEQEIACAYSTEIKSKNEGICCKKLMGPEGSMTSLTKASSMKKCFFDIGPPARITKEINASTIENQFSLPLTFCEKIGLRRHCTITLKTSMSSTKSWLARLRPYELCSHLLGSGWKSFCHDNGIRVGDVCTFTIVETNLWHVTIDKVGRNSDSVQLCDRIPDELAAEIGAGTGDALVIGPSGVEVKVWKVEVRRDGDGAVLGRGWPEFAAACGAGEGWFLVLRHRGRGVLTVKAFDPSYCLREFGAPAPPSAEATVSSKARFKPQFIHVLPQDSMENMLIPAKFVQHYILKEHLDNCKAVIFVPLGKICQIEVKMNQSGVFFAGGWSQFLLFHNIKGPNTLLLRYEGNMVFTVKVFEPNRFLRAPKDKDIRMQQKTEQLQETPPLSIQKHESKNYWPSNEGEGQKKPKGSMTILKKRSKIYCVYDIGPPAWMKKKVDTTMIEKHHFTLPHPFCDAIGFQKPCMITLQASMDSTKLWQVQGHTYNTGSCQLGSGWNIFCRDTRLREGDVLTINVIRTTLWRIVITRGKENINQSYRHHGTPSSGQGEKRPNGSLTYLEHVKNRCVFEIGPPAWVKKEINTKTIEEYLSLSAVFCHAIGLQETCLITLKISLCGARSWQVAITPHRSSSHRGRLGWKRFCQDNELKVGDVCTFNIVETRLWHRIPDELAEDIGAAEAHLEIPFGKGKVRRRVEVGRDGDGAFLGRGWKEFAAACGVGAGWLLVLRHRGGGVLTVKVFDDSGCLRELAAQPSAVEAIVSSDGASRRLQFIIVFPQGFMEKMQIPAVFVQSYIPKEDINSNMAVVYVPLGKTGHIEVEVNRSDVFFAGGWSKFLSNNSITAANCLLLRYEGTMVFTLKVFEPNGFQRESKHSDIIFQQNDQNMVTERKHETPSASIQECNSNNNWLGSEGQNKAKISKTYSGKESFPRYSFYKIEPPSWIQKQINTNSLKKNLALARAFCDAIGLRESRMITLKISTDSNASWQVHGMPSKNSSYMIMGGWKRFCKENRLKEGDICTFNIVEPTLWNVVITRYNEQEIACAYSTEIKSKNDGICCKKLMGPEGSMTSLTKASSMKKCFFDIGPPARITKEINASTIENQFNLPLTFCEKIGLRRPCTITLKTSMSSTRSWLARLRPYELSSHLLGPGWKSFCHDNGIRVGDVCTFTIVETNLWHVTIPTEPQRLLLTRLTPAMASPGNHGAAARKELRVLLPFSFDNLRIPDELAAEIGAGDALVIGPSGGEVKVWKVEVQRDGDGAVLGRGWPEFAAACGAGAGWFLVLRHRGRGVLTVKAFDTSYCLRELGAPAPPADEATLSSKARFKLQFIHVLPQDFMEKMVIPAKFVQHYILKEHLDNCKAVIFVPLGKICQIELKMNQSGLFFAGGWSQFLLFHNITGPNTLLLRYEGNMVFTVKVFEPNGCLRGPKHKDIRMQQTMDVMVIQILNSMSHLSYQVSTLAETEQLQETPPLSIQKHEGKNYWPSNEGEGQKKPKGSMTILKKRSKIYCVYDIGPPAWMKKKANTTMIESRHFTLPRPFCNAIGFQEPCMITLQASMDSPKLWQVQGHTYDTGSCQLGSGWKIFCRDTRLREGDVLTIN
ncbi:hypothetical protein EJB05_50909, partial [Eragrostis curvula]